MRYHLFLNSIGKMVKITKVFSRKLALNFQSSTTVNQFKVFQNQPNLFFSVAVLACFVTFRTPLHIEKAIFVITTVTQKWDENMVYYHGILKLIAGM